MTNELEKVVLKDCLELCQLHDLYVWRNNSGAIRIGKRLVRFGKTGSSDIIGITNDGRFLAIECKREKGGVLSDLQKAFLFNITQKGGIALCVRSASELEKELKKHNVIK